jgi:hypothetical protein
VKVYADILRMRQWLVTCQAQTLAPIQFIPMDFKIMPNYYSDNSLIKYYDP